MSSCPSRPPAGDIILVLVSSSVKWEWQYLVCRVDVRTSDELSAWPHRVGLDTAAQNWWLILVVELAVRMKRKGEKGRGKELDFCEHFLWFLSTCKKLINHMPIKMSIIKNTLENNKCWQGCGETGTLVQLVECKMAQPLWKTAWGSWKKLKIELPCDLAILLWWFNQKKWKQGLKGIFVHPCSLQHYSQQPRDGSNTQCPPTAEGDKEDVVYAYSAICSLKKEGHANSCYSVDESWGPYAATWNKSVSKDRYCIIPLT